MEKSKVEFFDRSLNITFPELEKVGKLRFQKLDQFNRDCKLLNEQLKRYGVPDVDWVFVDDCDETRQTYCLGYHHDTLVWKDWEKNIDIAEGSPIFEAPADVRASIMNDGLLKYLLQDAILALQDLKDLGDIKNIMR